MNRARRQAARSASVQLAEDGFVHTDAGFEFRYNPISPHEVEVWRDGTLVDTVLARGEPRTMTVDEVRSAATAWLMVAPERA